MEKIIYDGQVYTIDIPVGARYNQKGEYYMICPVCTPTREPGHQKEAKMAVNLLKNPRPWRCNHCEAKGYIIDEEYLATTKVKPILNIKGTLSISDNLVKWFWDERRISIQTLRDFNISMTQESILHIRSKDPELKGKYANRKCINFPYYKRKTLINVKYRDMEKNFKMIADASKILYNIDSLLNSNVAVIVEGEFDAMAYHEAGIPFVVSVPNGVTITPKELAHFEKTGQIDIQSNINLEYLDNCIEVFDQIETVYIATDTDAAGIKLREELARRIGKAKCRYIKFDSFSRYASMDKDCVEEDGKCNDPNDVLKFHGKKALADTLKTAIAYPVEGVTRPGQYWDIMATEYDKGRPKGLSTGYLSLDPHYTMIRGWLTVINGYPGEGKSSFLFNLICITTILYNWKWGMYCPENYPPKNIIDTLAEIVVGNTADYDFPGTRMTKKEYEVAITDHLNKHIYFLDNETGFTPAQLRAKKQEMVRQYGIVGFLTDPWKNLIHDRKGMGIDEYIQQELNHEVRFSQKNNILNIIAHHPPTPPRDKDKNYSPPSSFELIGGQIWFSTCYAMLCIHKESRSDWGNTNTEIHVQKIKEHKLAGVPTDRDGPVVLRFDRRTNRYYERDDITDESSEFKTYPVKDLFDNTEQLDFVF